MAAASSLRRVDLRFVLPQPPRRAVVLGAAGWAEGLAAAGVDVVAAGEPADLAVAPARLAAAAAATGAAMLLLEGGTPAGPMLRRRGYAVRRLLTLPRPAAAQFVVDPARSRAAAAYAGRRLPRGGPAGAVLGLGLAPPVPASVLVAVRADTGDGVPALLREAAAFGADPGAGWFLALGAGGVRKRAAFLLFPAGSTRPSHVLKFTRQPATTEGFDRDRAGLALAAQAGPVVAGRGPALVGRGVAAGVPASVETAVPGVPLTRLLPRGRGLAVADSVAAWTVEAAAATAAPAAALAAERDRLAAAGAADLVAALPPVPGVFRHGDLWPDNVLVDGDRWGVVDWEHAHGCSLPLADLLFFAAHALGPADPVGLFAGTAAGSARLARWVRAAAAALDLPDPAVGVLAALAWHDHGARAAAARQAREAATGERVPPYLPERLAAAWRDHPALGPGWRAWRS